MREREDGVQQGISEEKTRQKTVREKLAAEFLDWFGTHVVITPNDQPGSESPGQAEEKPSK